MSSVHEPTTDLILVYIADIIQCVIELIMGRCFFLFLEVTDVDGGKYLEIPRRDVRIGLICAQALFTLMLVLVPLVCYIFYYTSTILLWVALLLPIYHFFYLGYRSFLLLYKRHQGYKIRLIQTTKR